MFFDGFSCAVFSFYENGSECPAACGGVLDCLDKWGHYKMNQFSKNSKTLAGLSVLVFVLTGAALAQSTKGSDSSSQPSVSKSLPIPSLFLPSQQVPVQLKNLVAHQMKKFGTALGIPAEEIQKPQVERHGAFIISMTEKHVYCVDMGGNQIFRPREVAPYFTQAFSKNKLAGSEGSANNWRQVCTSLGLEPSGLTVPIKKSETLFLCDRSGGKISSCQGRTSIRMTDTPNNQYFQITSFDSKPIRIDTNLPCLETEKIKGQLRLVIADSSSTPGNTKVASPKDSAVMTVGTFYDPHEYEFKVNAVSYGGEEALRLGSTRNPFKPINYDLRSINFVDPDEYMSTPDYKYWCYQWWTRNGQVGGLRGNYNPGTATWDNPNVNVKQFPLKNYGVVGGLALEQHNVTLSDGKTYPCPLGYNQRLDSSFDRDLEQCTIAAFFTHGGPVAAKSGDLYYNLRRGLDIFFTFPSPNANLGQGQLRHVFLQGCSGMEHYNRKSQTSLLLYLLKDASISGLRTICGVDGGLKGLDRDGWKIAGLINKGDSISESWRNASIDESRVNCPVTVSYGGTSEEALSTLGDGRFSTRKTMPAFSAASDWNDAK